MKTQQVQTAKKQKAFIARTTNFDLHSKFNILCRVEGVTAQEMIIKMIESYVKNNASSVVLKPKTNE